MTAKTATTDLTGTPANTTTDRYFCALSLVAAATVLGSALVGCGSRGAAPGSFEAFSKTYAASTSGDCDEHCLGLRQEFGYVVYVGRQIYAYWDLKRADTGIDYDALARTLEDRIVTGTSPSQYYTVLQSWAASLHDGHVNAMPPADLSSLSIFSAPVRLELLAPATDHEQLIVSEVKEPGLVSVGDVVTAVNGVPTADALSAAEKIVSGSTARMRRGSAARRLTDMIGLELGAVPLTLTVKSGTSPEVTRVLARSVALNAAPDPSAVAAPAATGAELIKASVLAGNIGYLRIDGFSGTQDSALLDQALSALAATKGLVIDLRLNGGGDQSGNALISRFATATVNRYSTSERLSDFILSQRPEVFYRAHAPGADFADWHENLVAPTDDPTKRYVGKPVVALTSARCFSACDTFVAGLKANHLATVVGEGSGGGTGTPLEFSLPISGFEFRYAVVRGRTADGTWIESAGTLPDHVVEPTVADRIGHRDPQLTAALSLIDAGTAPLAAQQVLVSHGGDVSEQGLDVAPEVVDIRALQRAGAQDGMD